MEVEGDAMETEESGDPPPQGDPDDDPEDPNGDEGDKPLDSNDYAEECYRELTLMGPFPWHSAENRRIFGLYKRVNERDAQVCSSLPKSYITRHALAPFLPT